MAGATTGTRNGLVRALVMAALSVVVFSTLWLQSTVLGLKEELHMETGLRSTVTFSEQLDEAITLLVLTTFIWLAIKAAPIKANAQMPNGAKFFLQALPIAFVALFPIAGLFSLVPLVVGFALTVDQVRKRAK